MCTPSYQPSDAELTALDTAIGKVTARHRLFGPDADDFAQTVHLHFLEHGYEPFARFQGRSSLRTYLTVVVTRLLLDWRNSRYGKWRPSIASRRLGATAVEIDRLMNRDGYSREQACDMLAARGQLPAGGRELAAAVPVRPRPSRVPVETLDRQAEPFRDPIETGEARHETRRRTNAVVRAYRLLDVDDRRLIALRFMANLPYAEISRRMRMEPRVLYRRLERSLLRLRRSVPDLTASA